MLLFQVKNRTPSAIYLDQTVTRLEPYEGYFVFQVLISDESKSGQTVLSDGTHTICGKT